MYYRGRGGYEVPRLSRASPSDHEKYSYIKIVLDTDKRKLSPFSLPPHMENRQPGQKILKLRFVQWIISSWHGKTFRETPRSVLPIQRQ